MKSSLFYSPPPFRIEVCLEEVDNNAFNAYTNFFTHTQNMCYFLQSQVSTTLKTPHSTLSQSSCFSTVDFVFIAPQDTGSVIKMLPNLKFNIVPS